MASLSWITNGTRWFKGSKKPRRVSVDYMKNLPTFDTNALAQNISIKEYLEKDPDLISNIRRLVDNILLSKPILVPKAGEEVSDEILKEREAVLNDNRFFKKLRSGIYSLIWAGNAFFEIQYTSSGSLKEIYFIDPEYIKLRRNKQGEIIGYVQETPGHPVVNFSKDNIVHITLDHLDSGASGTSFIGALRQALARKDVAESYLDWLISNNKLNRFWLVKGDMDEESIEATLQMLRYSSRDPNKTTVIQVDEDTEVEFERYFDTEDFQAIQNYIDEQKKAILSVLQVPPIIAGNVDNSNRSNSEVQARFVFYNTVLTFQNAIAEELHYELFKKIGWDDCEFKFKHTDRAVLTDVLKVATAMQGLNFTEDAISEYLKSEGFELPKVDELFKDPMEMEAALGMDATGRNPMKPTPSREPRSKTGIPENEARRKDDKKMGVSKNESN